MGRVYSGRLKKRKLSGKKRMMWMGGHRAYDLSITNLGRVDMPVEYGELTLTEVYGPILTVSPRETVLGVNAVGGAIHFVLACEGQHDTTAIGETAMAHLCAAAGLPTYQM